MVCPFKAPGVLKWMEAEAGVGRVELFPIVSVWVKLGHHLFKSSRTRSLVEYVEQGSPLLLPMGKSSGKEDCIYSDSFFRRGQTSPVDWAEAAASLNFDRNHKKESCATPAPGKDIWPNSTQTQAGQHLDTWVQERKHDWTSKDHNKEGYGTPEWRWRVGSVG